VQNRTLIVAAPDWRPRQGWDEALKSWSAPVADEEEDEETLAYWASLDEPAPWHDQSPHCPGRFSSAGGNVQRIEAVVAAWNG